MIIYFLSNSNQFERDIPATVRYKVRSVCLTKIKGLGLGLWYDDADISHLHRIFIFYSISLQTIFKFIKKIEEQPSGDENKIEFDFDSETLFPILY